MSRVGHEAKMQRENAPESSAGLVSCVESGAGYLSNSDRFHSDTSGEEYEVRMEQYRKKEAAIQFRKNQSQAREEARWKTIEEKKEIEANYQHKVREEGLKGVKNQSCVAYNILSLDYDASEHGEVQKYVDDMVRYRAELRKNELVKNSETRATYNIINGSDREALHPPKELVRPNVAPHVWSKVDTRRT